MDFGGRCLFRRFEFTDSAGLCFDGVGLPLFAGRGDFWDSVVLNLRCSCVRSRWYWMDVR